jgi:1-acyl-sn-glycerol-3-phosphate acyltransferase
MKSALGRWYFSAIQIVPVDRDRGDVAAMKGVLRALKQGHCVALFPEGTRSYDGELQPAKRGIGFMVIKAGVCVVPMYVDGTHEALPRGASRVKRVKLRTIVGEPIAVEEFAALGSGKEAYGKAADLVMERIRALKPG